MLLLYDDADVRIEVEALLGAKGVGFLAASELTHREESFAELSAGCVVIAAARDPLRLLAYWVSAGIRTPVIMLSRKRSKPNRSELLKCGAFAAHVLPIDAEMLASQIHEASAYRAAGRNRRSALWLDRG